MTATILSFGRRNPNTPPLPAKMPWQNQDLAELYRVRDRLAAAGLDVEVEAGVTDEGDPWFVYMQAGTDNAVVHIARIDSEIHVINCVTGGAYVGASFREVSDRMLEEAPLALSAQVRRASNVVLHPSAFLTAFVAAALMLIDLMQNNHAEAATHHGAADAEMGAAGVWTITTGAHADAAVPHDAPLPAQAGANGADGSDPMLHRRGLKDGASPTAAPSPIASSAPMTLAATGTGGFSGHGGFLAEVPGVGASVTLAAGILAAELARSFTSEGEHGMNEAGSLATGLAKDFASLLSAFAGVEPAYAKAALPELDQSSSLNSPIAAFGAPAETPAAAHVTVAASESLTGAVSVKSAPDGFVEHAVFVAPAAHKAVVPSSTPTSGQAQSASQAAVAAQDASRPAGNHADSTTAVAVSGAASAPAASVATPTSAAASPAKAEAVKDGAALDLGWIVSQLVKHGSVGELAQTTTGATVPPSSAVKDAATALLDLEADSAKGSGSVTASLEPGKLAAGLKGEAGKLTDTKTDTTALQGSSASASAGSDTPHRLDPLSKAEDGVTLTPAGGTIALESGHHETLVYKAGSFLTVENFVFGEDYLSFDAKLGDAMAAHAKAEGADLVLGDAETGSVRLVGVLADTGLLSHLHDARPSAA